VGGAGGGRNTFKVNFQSRAELNRMVVWGVGLKTQKT
jgi:hypothetical protein